MDKLRAIQYFNCAVKTGSFAEAARVLEVSAPAITQLVAQLEYSLGTILLHRSARGLALTEDGERYYRTSQKIEAELREVELRVGSRGPKPRGTLVVGMRPSVAASSILPQFGRFADQYPDIEVVTKPIITMDQLEESNVDVAILMGWPPKRDMMIVHHLIQTRHVICASPDYWGREGIPSEPDDLRNHKCLAVRSATGVVLDRWTFERGADRKTVDVSTRLVSSDGYWLEAAACSGAGVARFADVLISRALSSGLLTPVLVDWEAVEAPTIYCAHWRNLRSSKPVRAFVDFVTHMFDELDSQRNPAPIGSVTPVVKPKWFGRAHGRRSAYTQ